MNKFFLHYLKCIGPICRQSQDTQLAGCLKNKRGKAVDKGPSTDWHHHFVKKEKKKSCNDMWYTTCDKWHATCDTWHMTDGKGVNIFLKSQLPSSYRETLFWIYFHKGSPYELVNQWMTKVLEEQLRLHWICHKLGHVISFSL